MAVYAISLLYAREGKSLLTCIRNFKLLDNTFIVMNIMSFDLSRHAISTKIQNGEYFKEARNWYAIKYLSAKTQHLYWLIIAIISVGSAYVAIGTSVLDQETKDYPLPLYFNNSVKYFPQIVSLSQPGDSINISIARYLVNYYINAREGYNPLKIDTENWNKHLSRIQSLSSRRVFSQYQAWIDPAINPDSPIIIYKDNTERTIHITRVVFSTDITPPDSATAFFTATETNKDSTVTSNWAADVKFSMADTDMVLDNPSSMQFVITYYNTRLIGN